MTTVTASSNTSPIIGTVQDKNGKHVKETQFFVRVANGTKALDDDEKQKYLAQRWPGDS